KTEAMLRLSGLDFEKEYVADLSKMPKGKVPVLQDGENLIPDSSLIQRYLTETYGIDLDKHLTTEQKAIAEAFRRMTEEHLYWTGVYNRF
ncbi:Tom37 metaxin N-terminal-like domain-containing protein, partial [Lactobacillus gasseri]